MDRRTREAELIEELELHRAMRQDQLEQSGVEPRAAAYASRRALGNAALAREDARDVWSWPSLEQIWRDARYAARILRRQPTFALTAILTLAAAIAVTTTASSVVEAELWRALPFPEPDRLVAVYTTDPGGTDSSAPVSVPDFLDWRSRSRAFAELAAFRWSARHVLRADGAAESVRGLPVTANFFSALGRAPALGRTFAAADEPGRSLVLSDACWRRVFSADPQVVGRALLVDDKPSVVIGVATAEALEFIGDPDFFALIDLRSSGGGDRRARDLVAIGRLKAGVDRGSAAADLSVVNEQLTRDYPAEHLGRGIRIDTLQEAYTGWNSRPLYLFLGAATLVLVLSCANVANLLLARAIGRQREFAIRGALGGGRGALVRQLLVEGAMVALPGALSGVLLARWALAVVTTWLPASYVNRGGQFALGSGAVVVTIAIASLTVLLFSLAPVLVAGRRDLRATLAQGGRTVAGSPIERRARHALVVTEISLALVLLVAAGLFVNSFVRLTHLPLGFEPRDRLTLRIPAAGTRYAEPAQIVAFSAALVAEIGALPGVRDVAIANTGPLEGSYSLSFVVPDRPRPATGAEPRGLARLVTPAYFRTMDIRRLAGRDFTAQDAAGAPRVAAINERLAHRLIPGENPIGRALVLLPGATLRSVPAGPVEIVAVVSNIKDVGMNEVDFNNVYLPFAQNPTPSLAVFARTSVPAAGTVSAIREVVRRLDPQLPIIGIETMEERVTKSLRGDRFHLMLVSAFAVLAIVLATVGIYGAMTYAIAQRMQEFGIRVALGSSRAGILGLAFGQSMRLGLLGIALGLGASFALARLLGDALYLVQGKHSGLIYGVSLTDPLTLASACALLLGVTALAGLVPARRATQVDPVMALRSE